MEIFLIMIKELNWNIGLCKYWKIMQNLKVNGFRIK